MTDKEFEIYLAKALAELKAKQAHLEQEYDLGRLQRFHVDYEKEQLQFFRGERIVAAFAITAVGSHVSDKDSWRWCWANTSLPEKVRRKAEGVKRLYDLTGFDLFKQTDVLADETMAWEFVALSAKVLGALGAYSMPQGNLRTYVLINAVIPTADAGTKATSRSP